MPTSTVPHKIELSKWSEDMLTIEDVVLAVGKKKTGKTSAIMALCHHFRKISEGVAFAGSAGSYRKFKKIIPETYIYDDWDENIFSKIITETQKENFIREAEGLQKKHRFIIIDDCGWNQSFCNSKALKRGLMNGRNDGITPLFVALQYPLDFKPAVRGQFDWVFLFRDTAPTVRKRFFDHYAGQLGNYKLFEDVFDAVTEDHGCLVIRNCGTSNKIEDNFFWWRAPVRDWDENPKQKKWHMGSKKYWEYHFENFDRKWREKEMLDSEDEERVRRKKKIRSTVHLKN